MSHDRATCVVLPGDADKADIDEAVQAGLTVLVEGTVGVYVRDESGRTLELSPDEHPDYVEVGSIHGTPEEPDEPDLDGDDYLQGTFGRIGGVYFEHDKDSWSWSWCGELDSDDEAEEYVSGAEFYVVRSI